MNLLDLLGNAILFLPEGRCALVMFLFGFLWYTDLLSVAHFARKLIPFLNQQQQHVADSFSSAAHHLLLQSFLLKLIPAVVYLSSLVAALRWQRQGRYSPVNALVMRILASRTPAIHRPFFGASAILTGANSGVGEVNAKQLAALGFRVVCCCRSREKAAASRAQIVADDPEADVRIVIGDLSELSQIKSVAQAAVAAAKEGGCFFSLLVQNAGMFEPTKCVSAKYKLDSMILTNHVGPFFFVETVRPQMEVFPGSDSAFRRSSGGNTAAIVGRASGDSTAASASTTASASSLRGGGAKDEEAAAVVRNWQSPRIVIVSSIAHEWANLDRLFNNTKNDRKKNDSQRKETEAETEEKEEEDIDMTQTTVWRALEKSTEPSCNAYALSKECNVLLARMIQLEQDDINAEIERNDDAVVLNEATEGMSAQQKKAKQHQQLQLLKKKRLESTGVTVAAVHPGWVSTNIFRTMNKSLSDVAAGVWAAMCWLLAKDCDAGSQTMLHCAIAPEIINGGFYCECALFPASNVANDDAEVRAMEAWTRKKLAGYW